MIVAAGQVHMKSKQSYILINILAIIFALAVFFLVLSMSKKATEALSRNKNLLDDFD